MKMGEHDFTYVVHQGAMYPNSSLWLWCRRCDTRLEFTFRPAAEHAALLAEHAALGELLEVVAKMEAAVVDLPTNLWESKAIEDAVNTATKARAAYRAAGGEK